MTGYSDAHTLNIHYTTRLMKQRILLAQTREALGMCEARGMRRLAKKLAAEIPHLEANIFETTRAYEAAVNHLIDTCGGYAPAYDPVRGTSCLRCGTNHHRMVGDGSGRAVRHEYPLLGTGA